MMSMDTLNKIMGIIMTIVMFFSALFYGAPKENINANADKKDDINPDQWTAVDGLGRTLPDYEKVGAVKEDKFVGLFYWTWHTDQVNGRPARNTTQVLKQYPEAVNDFTHFAWENTPSGTPYFWDEPLYGYYVDTDKYVLRKQMELIADAGVDVIFFDATNGTFTWKNSYEALFAEMEEAKQDGVRVPQVAFMLNFSGNDNSRIELRQLYDDIYSLGRYQDLWFYWDGKPLIMAHSNALDKKDDKDKEILNFFTYRSNEPTYFADDTKYKEEVWGWCSNYLQTKFGTYNLNKNVEQMTVSVAQNSTDTALCAMNNPLGGVHGRSYASGDYSYSYEYAGKTIKVDKNIENSSYYGLNFQQQWDNAIKANPEFIFVTGWNEWIAGRFDEWMGTENAFPDEFSAEYSRDIEPSAGELKDYYYYQLVSNIRRFKGVSEPEKIQAAKTIDINGDRSQWNDVTAYNHYTGSTISRDTDGWVGSHYTNDSMRNDIVTSKVAYDDTFIYFYVSTKDKLTPSTDKAWMRLLIDTDTSGVSDNWEGFEYIINRLSPNENSVSLEKSTGGWHFTKVCDAAYSVSDNVLQLKIPRSALGLNGTVKFNFKWSDNMKSDGDIMDFYLNGDVAPGGRYAFAFNGQ